MNSSDPIAYFITWTVYGTFLQGDDRWWRDRTEGSTPPQPKLERWHRDRLNHDVILLSDAQRELAEEEIERLGKYRGWRIWTAAARTNHIHVIVTAPEHSPKQVRDQLKANCTRVLREAYPIFVARPIWTVGGDRKPIYTKEALDRAIIYVSEAQDRMERGK